MLDPSSSRAETQNMQPTLMPRDVDYILPFFSLDPNVGSCKHSSISKELQFACGAWGVFRN